MGENKNFQMVAKTFKGLEDVLAKELEDLGAQEVQTKNRMVEFNGDKELMYRANYHLRTALRVLKPIAEFKAKNENELYEEVQKIDWDEIFSLKQTFAIDSVVNSEFFSHSKYVALKMKDAIVDQFRDKYKKRPFVETENSDIRINLHIAHDVCTILLDSSGESLHRRGYRTKATKAPLNEVLAAGMILISGWDKKSPLIDPMCGSGTILIEAAMMANGIPPGMYREKFGFENWKDFDADLFEEIVEEEYEECNDVYVYGSDVSEIAIRIAKRNIANASLSKKINLLIKPIEGYEPPSKNGVVVTNPPYGERIKKNEINAFYKVLGDKFKQSYNGYNIWMISSNNDAIKHVGLQHSHKMVLFNGPLECRYLKYEIYEGSKKMIPSE
ncbi:MAG: THUMP domain-containing protein [Bacteroidales bacterium]|nr:THUMP domain-containing protein [Bacteroidales bacterium]